MATEQEYEGYPGIAHDLETMRQQRDELAETLSALADILQVWASSGDPRPASWADARIAKARAALACIQLKEEA